MDTKPLGFAQENVFPVCFNDHDSHSGAPGLLSPSVPWEGCFVLKSDSVAETALPSSGEENDVFFPSKYLEKWVWASFSQNDFSH